MAGDWIKIQENMPEKPEVAEIAEMLGIEDPDTVAGKLIRVWSWATRNCNADGVTNVTAMKHIDRCAGVTGFAKSMEKAGWLVVSNGRLVFPNFDRHISQTAKERALTSKRVAKHRANSGNGSSVTKTLPEKRREEVQYPSDIVRRFSKPTVDEVAEYGATLSPPFTKAAKFHSFYESNGWKVGKNPMKDWKAAVRTWNNENGPQHREKKAQSEYTSNELQIPILNP